MPATKPCRGNRTSVHLLDWAIIMAARQGRLKIPAHLAQYEHGKVLNRAIPAPAATGANPGR